MSQDPQNYGFKSDTFINIRVPWNIAKDKKRCVLRKDEIRCLTENCQAKVLGVFVSKFLPAVGQDYSPTDLHQIGYVFYQATVNRFNPSKIKDPRVKYKRPAKGLYGSYTEKQQVAVEKQKKALIRWFEVCFFRYINSFRFEVLDKTNKKGPANGNYGDDFIEAVLNAKAPEPYSKDLDQMKERLRGIATKEHRFKRFILDLAKRPEPAILRRKYAKDFMDLLSRADDLQYEISEITNTEPWNNDAYFALEEE